MKIIILTLCTLFLTAQCNSSKKTTDTSNSDLAYSAENFKRINLPDDIASINYLSLPDGMTDFSMSLFSQISKEKSGENVCISPVSLNMALAMVYIGAKDKTADEMSTVLKFNSDLDIFIVEFKNYLDKLNLMKTDKEVQFNVANKVFIEQSYKVLEKYRNDMLTYFDGSFEEVSFRNNAPQVEAFINNWVSEMTMKRINNLIPKGTLDAMTRLVLVNAVYIKSKWRYAFKKEDTHDKYFYATAEDKKLIPFMTQRVKNIKYAAFDDKLVVELPYTTPHLSLIIIRPNESNAQNIKDFAPDVSQYKAILKNLKPQNVYIEIPKFKIESSFSLVGTLKEMGIQSAFSNADFSGISGHKDLVISKILQKVFFEIDEEGTEAAAATAIVIKVTSAMPDSEERYVEFIANRPFIYILKENNNNTPLFMGQYVKPNSI